MKKVTLKISLIDELKASIKLGSPLILTNLAQVALLTTNLIFIVRLGKVELAAGSLAASLYHAFMIFSLGLVSATIPMLATSLGKNRDNFAEIQKIIRHGFLTAFIICMPFLIVLWNADKLLLALGQNPDTIEIAIDYIHLLMWSLLPYLGYIVLRSLLAALEKPMWTLLVAFGGFFVNAFLGWLFIFGNWGMPALGIAGAGLAITLTNILMFSSMLLLIHKHSIFSKYQVFKHFWHWNPSYLGAMWKLGLPIAVTFTLETLVFYGLGVGFMAIAASVMWLKPEMLIAFFINASAPENRAVIITATQFLFFAALFQLADGAQAVAAGMLRGFYDTRTPMVLALIGYWLLGVPIGAFLAFGVGMEGVGIWIGFVTGLSVVAALLTIRWWRHTQRLLKQPEFHYG